MNCNNRLFLYLMVVMAALLFASCHSTKKVTGTVNDSAPEKTRYEAVVNNYYKYDALQSKVKLSLGSNSLNGKFCLESGKRLGLSANAPLLGFELGRIEATADSVVIVYKLEKLYCVVSLSELTKIKGLKGHEMEALECLILGRIFIPGVGKATVKDFDRLVWSSVTNANGTMGNSMGIFDGGNYQLTYEINGNAQLVSTSLQLPDGKTATWNYNGYQEVEKQKSVAETEDIRVISGKNGVNARMTMTNPSFGKSEWKAFDPSSSYRKVSIEELYDMLKKLL